MQIRHDPHADAIYIKLNDKTVSKARLALGFTVILDLDEQDEIVGIEILNVSHHISKPNEVAYVDITREAVIDDNKAD